MRLRADVFATVLLLWGLTRAETVSFVAYETPADCLSIVIAHTLRIHNLETANCDQMTLERAEKTALLAQHSTPEWTR